MKHFFDITRYLYSLCDILQGAMKEKKAFPGQTKLVAFPNPAFICFSFKDQDLTRAVSKSQGIIIFCYLPFDGKSS